MFAHAGVLLESSCVGAACPGAAPSRAPSSVFFVPRGRHHHKVVAETSQVVVSLALGIFSFPIDLDCKPLLECSCFIPGDVENAMTAFSLTTRDIVEATHLDATAFIGTHSSLDEGVPRWALPILALKRRIWQRFPMFCYAVARSSQPTSLVPTIKIWRGFRENTFVYWCTCPIIQVRCACKVKHFKLEILLHFMVHVVDSSRN